MRHTTIEFFLFLGVFTIMVVSATLLFKKAYDSPCWHKDDGFVCVTYVDNYDADTITVNIPGVHPFLGAKAKVRLVGVDTPEIRGGNACEKRKAIEAKEYVKGRLVGKTLSLYNVQRGKYFRIVADVVVDGVSLSKELIAIGYGFPYDGGKKQTRDWCRELL